MVTDRQYRRLMKLIQEEQTLATAAAKVGMDEKTARKYKDLEELPSQTKGNGHGERERMRLRRYGRRFWGFWSETKQWRQRRYLIT